MTGATRTRRHPLGSTAGLLVLVAFALFGGLVALCMGPSGVGLGEVVTTFTGGTVEPHVETIVWTVRVPRVVLGLLVGAALSVAGLLIQALLQNDLAEPYLIGVGPGALLGVTVAALVAGAGSMPAAGIRAGFAFVFALAVAVIVFGFAQRTREAVITSVLRSDRKVMKRY